MTISHNLTQRPELAGTCQGLRVDRKTAKQVWTHRAKPPQCPTSQGRDLNNTQSLPQAPSGAAPCPAVTSCWSSWILASFLISSSWADCRSTECFFEASVSMFSCSVAWARSSQSISLYQEKIPIKAEFLNCGSPIRIHKSLLCAIFKRLREF